MSKIEKFRSIVSRGAYNKVEGVTVDLFTAGAVVAVYDALSPENQAKFVAMPVRKMAAVAFKLVK